jgi:hypothetical protein
LSAAVSVAGFNSACRLIQSRSKHAVAVDAGEMVLQVRYLVLIAGRLAALLT